MLFTKPTFGVSGILAALAIAACGGSVKDVVSSGSGTGGAGASASGAGANGSGSGSGSDGTGAAGSTGTATGGGGAGATSSTVGAGAGGGTPFDPADAPQVVDFGGSVLVSPKVRIISYANDPTAADVDACVAELGATSTWAVQTAEYGVGAFTLLPTISLPGNAPSSIDDQNGPTTALQQYIASQLSGPNPAWGAADPTTIYMLLMPQGTDVRSGGHCCNDYFGYHWNAQVGSVSVPYAVICDCAAFPGDPLTPLEYVTTTVNHELAEAATDPYFTNPAYTEADLDHVLWTIATGGEVADMCEYNEDANVVPPGATYMVQRSWSNAAASAGKNPCVPVGTSDPYFNSYPVLPSVVNLTYQGSVVQTKGIQIPVGQSATIDVKLVSDGPTAGPWTITAWDFDDYMGYGNPKLSLTLDKPSGKNGDILKLTIKVLGKDNSIGGEGFVLQSDLNGQQNLTMGAVSN